VIICIAALNFTLAIRSIFEGIGDIAVVLWRLLAAKLPPLVIGVASGLILLS
jgi:hypothetical protein